MPPAAETKDDAPARAMSLVIGSLNETNEVSSISAVEPPATKDVSDEEGAVEKCTKDLSIGSVNNSTDDVAEGCSSIATTAKESLVSDDDDEDEEEREVSVGGSRSMTSEEKNGYREIMGALTEEERTCLADEYMPLRHFRAEDGDTKRATQKIKNTIAWRKEFDVETLKTCATNSSSSSPTLSKIAFENSTGKTFVRGHDRGGRAIIYMRPGFENSTDVEWNLRHLVYNIERAVACTAKKTSSKGDKMCIVLDFLKFKIRSAPSLSTSKATLNILQDHYPERLHRAYICNPPWVFKTFWSLIKPFIDPVTKDKICFCVGEEGAERMAADFQLESMEKCAGGDGSLRPFDSKEYFETPFEYTFDEKY